MTPAKQPMSAMDEVMARMFGCSVMQRIKQVDQPKGGYIKPKEFKAELLGEETEALAKDSFKYAKNATYCVDTIDIS